MPDRPDTIYCEECKSNIPIVRTEEGTTIICCPKCSGECIVCDCHLAQSCFSKEEKVIVRHAPDPEA
jgi:hypothetical protein